MSEASGAAGSAGAAPKSPPPTRAAAPPPPRPRPRDLRLLLRQLAGGVLLLLVPVLLVLHLLQAEKLLALQLVQLALDVLDRVLQAGLHDVLPPVGRLDRLVQREEGRLQGGDLHQDPQALPEHRAALLHLRAPLPEPDGGRRPAAAPPC